MLTAKNLERVMELESSLRSEYQAQLDAKDATIEQAEQVKAEQKATIARQLEEIKTLSTAATANKRMEQHNRELTQRSENLQEEVAAQKKRLKLLQRDLAAERTELKALKQLDPDRMKKNLDANKKKLAEKTAANDLLQASVKQTKRDNAELTRKVAELEAKLAELESAQAEPGEEQPEAQQREDAAA